MVRDMSATIRSQRTVPFEDLLKPDVASKGLGPAKRIDPFYEMQWSRSAGGPGVAWRSLDADKEIAKRTHVTLTKGRHGSHNEAEALALLPERSTRIVTLSAINLWRTLTSQQLVALTGNRGLDVMTSDETNLLIDAGLIQRGTFSYDGRALDFMPTLFRPDPKLGNADLRHLRYGDALSVTLGGKPIKGHFYDRHNVLACEFGLRTAEMCPIRTSLGELAATWPRLFSPKINPNPYRSADGVIVREDGLRIAVELTATVTLATIQKIDLLADLLARDKSHSVVILFLVAADADHGEARRALRNAIKKYSGNSMSRVAAGVTRRMVIARWQDYFPAPGMVSLDLYPLRAQRYDWKSDDWIGIELLDPFDVQFEGADSPATQRLMANLNDCLGAPWWCRAEFGVDWDDYLLRGARLRG